MAFEVQRASKRLVKRGKEAVSDQLLLWLLGLVPQICAEDWQLAILNLSRPGVKPAMLPEGFTLGEELQDGIASAALSGRRPSYAEKM